MEILLHFLSSVHQIGDELLLHLSQTVKMRTVLKGQFILKAGHISRHIHFIGQGLLRCFYIKADTEVCSWFMKEGDVIISIESFYDQKESYESIQALEDCTLYYVEYNELQYIYRNFSEFNFIGRVLTERYHKLWAQQLYGIRMQPASERYQWLLNNFPELILRVPAKFIASYLGITEVTLSNIKSKKIIS